MPESLRRSTFWKTESSSPRDNQKMPLILPWNDLLPRIDSETFIAPDAVLIGDVKIGPQSSIWFKTIVRGDVNRIRIGRRTNIQDLSLCHVTTKKHELIIGDEVTVGHRCLLHGCRIGDRCLIGMGSTIMDGAVIGEESVVAAGAVVLEGEYFEPRSLIVGSPATRRKQVSQKTLERFSGSAEHYWNISLEYLKQFPEFRLTSAKS